MAVDVEVAAVMGREIGDAMKEREGRSRVSEPGDRSGSTPIAGESVDGQKRQDPLSS